MAPGASKFDPPKQDLKNDKVDPAKFKKLAVRVEEALLQHCLYSEPKQLAPELIIVAPFNRDGAPPNTRHCHQGICRSFKEKGFDKSRPAIGICILFTSEQGLKRLHEHNERFSKGNKLLPPIHPGACYGSLACSHYNIALRLIKAGTFSVIGNLRDLLVDSKNLKEVVESGHRWWILPETLSKERQVDISLWRNMDQNENQATHEIEILQGIRATAEGLSSVQDKISAGDLVAMASRRNPAKVSVTQMQILSKLYIGFLENGVPELAGDLVDHHSDTVDPREITVSFTYIQMVCTEEALSKCPHVRLHLILSQYSLDKTRSSSSGPSQGALFDNQNITTLCKKTDILANLENKIRDLKKEYLPILERTLSLRQARLLMNIFIDLILRCLFSKPWPLGGPKIKAPVGKFSMDKIKDLAGEWAAFVDLENPGMNFAEASGLKIEEEQDEDSLKELDLEGVRELKPSSSGGPDPDLAPKFARGDEVVVTRRMSWNLPQKGVPNFRKDIVVGTEGIVEGFADLENRLVLLKVVIDLPSGKKQTVTKECFPRNLKLSSEYALEKGLSADPTGSTSEKGGKAKAKKDPYEAPAWALCNMDQDSVKALVHWKDLLADKDMNAKMLFLRSRIGVSLQSLQEALPTYGDKDLTIVQRKNERGIWKSEVWTKRSFGPLELQLGPWSSQLKDTHLMAHCHAVVSLPKHGRGAHPENSSLALDGRAKNLLAPAGLVGPSEYLGSLFWVVTRTSKAAEANMSFENIAFESTVKMTLPAPKKRKVETSTWSTTENPQLPIMVNKGALKKNIKLVIFQAEKKAEKK